MSQIVPTLAAPPSVQIAPLDAPGLSRRDAAAGRGPVPFSNARAETPAGWIAGLVFGLLCLGAGLVVVVGFAVMATALVVGSLVGRWVHVGQPRTALIAP